MKKMTLIVATTALLTPTAALNARDYADRDHRDERSDHYREHNRHDYHNRQDRYRPHNAERPRWRIWQRGDRFDSRYAPDYRVLDHRRYRGLRPPPRGYYYVRSGSDAVLVDARTGVVAAVFANAIR